MDEAATISQFEEKYETLKLLGALMGIPQGKIDYILSAIGLFHQTVKVESIKNERDGCFAGVVRKYCDESCPEYATCTASSKDAMILEQTGFIFDEEKEALEYAEHMRKSIWQDFMLDMSRELGL